jgi:plasmid stabilization system protein ParE
LIGFTARAARQFQELRQHYEDRERPEAVRALIAALEQASRKIEANPGAGLSAPRPYPQLARPGRAWVKSGRYWIAAVFYDTANIPGRL